MGDDESVREESSETEDEQDEQVEGGKIAKPPGEAGRSRSGGFNLEEALDWEHNKYKKLTVSYLVHRTHLYSPYLTDMGKLDDQGEARWCKVFQ